MSEKASRDDDDADGRSKLQTDKKKMLEQRGFDRWLNRKLHEIYDEVLTEGVPDYLMRLVGEFDSEADTPPDNDGDDSDDTGESKP
jgi:hypothetical protein